MLSSHVRYKPCLQRTILHSDQCHLDISGVKENAYIQVNVVLTCLVSKLVSVFSGQFCIQTNVAKPPQASYHRMDNPHWRKDSLYIDKYCPQMVWVSWSQESLKTGNCKQSEAFGRKPFKRLTVPLRKGKESLFYLTTPLEHINVHIIGYWTSSRWSLWHACF